MVQNTKDLSYHSIILPLRFPISFTLHNKMDVSHSDFMM